MRNPEPEAIVATPVVVTKEEASNVAEMFDRAFRLLSNGEAVEAAKLFDMIVEADITGFHAPTAAFNAGLAWESAGERQEALVRFRDALRRAPDDQVGKMAGIRTARLVGHLERWGELSETADLLLARNDLTLVDRIEALGAKALALVESDQVDAAERPLLEARDLIESMRLGDGGQLPTAVAQVQFALGELRRSRSEQIGFVPLPANFSDALERRCQGLLDAQAAYTDAMRSFDPHWAAMSGYRVGQLYQRLHADILAIAPPVQADTPEKRALFEGAMRLRFRVLLEKGLKMMDHTVSLGERTGQGDAWIDRARTARDELMRSLAEEKARLEQLPYREEDLKRALDDLDRKSRVAPVNSR